jgi:hypothetical protein
MQILFILLPCSPPHHNVVRLYGYCFEAPTVCLILELLPGSLKALLYKQPTEPSATPTSQVDLEKQASTSQPTTYLSSYNASTASTTDLKDAACTTYITVSESVDMSETNSTGSFVDARKQMQPEMTSLAAVQKLSMLRVLHHSIDIAAGLKYLHEMPLVADVAHHTVTTKNESCKLLETVPETEAGTSSAVQSNTSTGVATQKTMKVVHRGELRYAV